jgi:hypothetical protein
MSIGSDRPAGGDEPDTSVTGVSTHSSGVSGTTYAGGQQGVYGLDVSAAGGYGVTGSSVNGTGVAGSTGGTGYGVYGVYGSSGAGYGVYGTSPDGTGVGGSTSGTGYGVYGTSNGGSGVYGISPDGSGVYGTSNGGSGVVGISAAGDGVYGVTHGERTFGVAGTAAAKSTGVYGFGDGDNAVGVYGEATGSGAIAVFAAGDATVTGSLSKSGGSFRIDHPLDPANKYLYHSFVESPDMKNVYDGTVTLDADGRAVVGLADWFETLNRDYRYQLTPIGGPAPHLHIAAEVSGGQFAIAGGAAGQKVCWQVTGIRQDAWANAHRIPVEETKPAEDQGRYLHPELHHGEPITRIARVRAHAERQRQSQHRQAAP